MLNFKKLSSSHQGKAKINSNLEIWGEIETERYHSRVDSSQRADWNVKRKKKGIATIKISRRERERKNIWLKISVIKFWRSDWKFYHEHLITRIHSTSSENCSAFTWEISTEKERKNVKQEECDISQNEFSYVEQIIVLSALWGPQTNLQLMHTSWKLVDAQVNYHNLHQVNYLARPPFPPPPPPKKKKKKKAASESWLIKMRSLRSLCFVLFFFCAESP